MSSRRTARDLSDQVNQIEEQLRRLLGDLAASASDLRFAFDDRGDLLVGQDDNVAARLGVGADGEVLTADPSALLGMAWQAVDALRASIFAAKGYLAVGSASGVAAGLEPTVDGEVLTLDSTAPLGMAWQASSETDGETLAWLAMAMGS